MDRPLPNFLFRTNPRRELVVFDRLTDAEKATLERRSDMTSIYGVLRSEAGGSLGVVDRDMALLLFTLREPSPIPEFVRREMDPGGLTRWLRGLLASRALEVQVGDAFLTGESALVSLEAAGAGESAEPDSRLARLSRAALESAAALPGDRRHRARWLYAYHRQPLTARRRRELGSEASVRAWLGLDGRVGAQLDAAAPRQTQGGWISWSFDKPTAVRHGPTYKLYVSPIFDATAAALERVAENLERLPVHQLKIGRFLEGLLRADKLVLYFEDLETLDEAARCLTERMKELEPQGVPFTAGAGLDGLLSWGADPPQNRLWTEAETRGSWRQWVTERLAEAFDEVDANRRENEDAGASWHRVLDLLALEGIDTDGWTPDPVRWLGLEEGP